MKAAKITGAAGQVRENLPNRRKAAPSRRNPLPNPPGAPAGPIFFVRCREKQSLFVCYLLVIIIFAFMMNEAEEGTASPDSALFRSSECSAGQNGAPLGSSEASAGQNGAPLGSSEASAGQNGAPLGSSEASAGQNGTPFGLSECSD